MLGEDGHQYIEIGYYFAQLMLHAQGLKFLDDGKSTPIDGSPVSRTSSDMSSHEAKRFHMIAISRLSIQILQRARHVEVAEIRVPLPNSLSLSTFLNKMLMVFFRSM